MPESIHPAWYLMRTYPMTVAELAQLFDTSPRRFKETVLPTLDATACGKRWRVKIFQMPPRYWIETGLIDATSQPERDS